MMFKKSYESEMFSSSERSLKTESRTPKTNSINNENKKDLLIR